MKNQPLSSDYLWTQLTLNLGLRL